MAPRLSPAARRALRSGQCGAKSTSGTSAVSLRRRAQLSYGCHDDSCGAATTTARPSPSATRAAVHGTTPSSLAPLESPHLLSVLFSFAYIMHESKKSTYIIHQAYRCSPTISHKDLANKTFRAPSITTQASV
uniref:Uncharacterized protein n=1 Tax=Oryza rufipogon TaxID=4529 RepID=A0A0E0Q603_ORYRU